MFGRILYVALADARGHLMRAHLLRRTLAAHGVAEVTVVTTSEAGQAFLASSARPPPCCPTRSGSSSTIATGWTSTPPSAGSAAT
jgi:hypothetical protein